MKQFSVKIINPDSKKEINFSENKLFQKRGTKNRFEIFLKEISLVFNLKQIDEGGFFVMIGKKL